jgi:hypothetical protein
MSETLDGIHAELPKYKCHKEVYALKIRSVDVQDGKTVLTPEDTVFAPFPVDEAYVQKHKPDAGGYYVVYADGYKSFSPAKAFEDGYTKL